jgi:hypothetical protein
MVMMELGLHVTSQFMFQWLKYSLLKDVVDWHVGIMFTTPYAFRHEE